MLKLSEVATHQWEFVYPVIYNRLMDEFHSGCDAFEEGNLFAAEKIFKSVLKQMPDHLDAIHHLAMVQSEQGQVDQARDLWEQSVRIGRKAFPPEFDNEKDRLEWGWLENRPFLRCLHGLAIAMFDADQTKEALKLFQELLRLNPNDNQGVRAVAAQALFRLGGFEEVIKLAGHYPDDLMPDILYGRALALFKLGMRKRADKALMKAIEILPLVRKELLKKRHRLPRTARPDRVTIGGPDEAYYYWQEWGPFWQDNPEALGWLKGFSI
jgi:tetratricopeptide (TPR) repeat protein